MTEVIRNTLLFEKGIFFCISEYITIRHCQY